MGRLTAAGDGGPLPPPVRTVAPSPISGRGARRDPVSGGPAAAGVDLLLDATVVAFAVWVVLFHLAVVFDWSRNPIFVTWVVGAGAVVLLSSVHQRTTRAPSDPSLWLPRGITAALAAIGFEIAAVIASHRFDDEGWLAPWFACVGLAAAAAALSWRYRDLRVPGPDRSTGPDRSAAPALATAGVVGIAVLAAIASLVTVRPDLDDVAVVNRATYVEQSSDAFPERDTIFSDEVFAEARANFPASAYEPFVGSVAAVLPVSAPFVSYLLVAPFVSALAILASWRLLCVLGARRPALAVAAMATFLALDGADNAAFGNLHFGRAWQGKVVFVMVVVPLLWARGIEYGRHGRRQTLAVLTAGSIAAVGLTTSSLFVAPPIVAIAVLAGCTHQGSWRRAFGGLVALAYPLGAAGGALIADPRPIEPVFARISIALGAIDPADSFYFIWDPGFGLFLVVAASLTAWLTVTERSARIALGSAAAVVFCGFFAPGTLETVDDINSSSVILWRVIWVMPVPVAIGLFLTAPLDWRWPTPRAVRIALPCSLLVLLAVTGTPVMAGENNASLGWPALDLPRAERASAEHLIQLLPDGGVVAAPQPVGGVLAVLSVDVRAVNPRWEYLTANGGVPEFARDARALLTAGMQGDLPPDLIVEFRQYLDDLDVVAGCSYDSTGPNVEAALADAGFVSSGRDDLCTFWLRTP